MSHHKRGAYDGFDSLNEVASFYKRCRRTKDFILSDAAVAKENPICAICGNKLTDSPKNHPDVSEGYKGNRCVYSPKLKKSACLHYLCAWESLITKVFALADRLY